MLVEVSDEPLSIGAHLLSGLLDLDLRGARDQRLDVHDIVVQNDLKLIERSVKSPLVEPCYA